MNTFIKEEYVPFGTEWQKELMKLPKKELILILKAHLKIKQVSSLADAENYVEGCVNDLVYGISTPEETISYLGKYTARLMQVFWKRAKEEIKNNPKLLND